MNNSPFRIILLSVACASVLALASSCETNVKHSLNDTKWGKSDDEWTVYIEFSGKNALLTYLANSVFSQFNYSYTYSYPTVKLEFVDSWTSTSIIQEYAPDEMTGTVSDEGLVLVNDSTGETFMTLARH
jgi:hypothetical protein